MSEENKLDQILNEILRQHACSPNEHKLTVFDAYRIGGRHVPNLVKALRELWEDYEREVGFGSCEHKTAETKLRAILEEKQP